MPELAEFEVRIKLDITIERPGSRHLLWRFLREGGGFGEAILEPLHQRVSELGALILRKVIVTKLLVFEKQVVGAVAVNLSSNRLLAFIYEPPPVARTTALKKYAHTDNPPGTTGDGYVTSG